MEWFLYSAFVLWALKAYVYYFLNYVWIPHGEEKYNDIIEGIIIAFGLRW